MLVVVLIVIITVIVAAPLKTEEIRMNRLDKSACILHFYLYAGDKMGRSDK